MQKSNPYSSRSLRENIRYAEIDKELFLLMQIPEQRQMLRQILISTYLTDEKGNDKHKGDILLACLCFPVLMWLGQPHHVIPISIITTTLLSPYKCIQKGL